ncbi:hypothetical protein K8352_16250 [Flavobacteriaceae bacterium F89]|uniref:Adenylate cyclase n=1 Tax=Cerina litoralis TaxID=2874477 RepID=A0AAE3JQW1_9FLAO|nr:hypothetical protein [Cerina litoralis]MCG2462314.1 hypothetical protein [Cerina litoralis]
MPSELIKTLSHSKKEIRDEMNRILSSNLFSRSSVLSNFLKFVVDETLEGRTEELKEYTIAVNALGKSADFNPQVDAIVRIHAGRLRRLLNEYYTGPGKTDLIKIEVVKGTYVPVFRTHLINKSNGITAEKNKTIQYSRSKLTLAVLPFRNLCPENEFQFFVDGFGEELTRLFSLSQDVSVVAHHSTRKYAVNPDDIRVIGTELGVHYMISGSVKRTAKEIRVNVELVETMNGIQIWSQTYNNLLNIDNLINIQDQIIENVCSLLGGYYGFIVRKSAVAHRKNPPSMVSFDAALWNYYFHMNFSQESYLKTRQALEEALRHDPNYAQGLAMLAELTLSAYSLGYPTAENPVNEGYKLAKKAIRIDPECQHAYQEYAWANIYLKRREEALSAMDRCLAINPASVSTMGTIGFGMACAGEYKRAHVLLTQSLNLNPHCPWWFYLGFFLVHYNNKQYKKALEYANKIETLDVFLDPLTKAAAMAQLGMTDEARADVKKLTKNFPQIADNLKTSLSTFLLDNSLVDEIVKGFNRIGASCLMVFLSLIE